MSFLAPGAFLLGLLLTLIVLLYLLKLKLRLTEQRIEQSVSSTNLWQRMVRDVEANSPWQGLHSSGVLR